MTGETIKSIQDEILNYVKQYGGNAGFLPVFGMYEITDKSLPVSTMYDRASIALASVKGNYAKRVSWYDAAMMQKIEENHLHFIRSAESTDKRRVCILWAAKM